MTRKLTHDQSGSSAAEFAIVLPLLLIFLFGIIDAGRWLWTYNRTEKATMMGARFAVVANPITDGLDSSYLSVGGLTQGDPIPASAFGQIQCTDSSCTCAQTPCPSLGTFTQQNFRNIVDRMKLFMPEIDYSDVTILYSSSGLGYAGNPSGADISPLVTVRLGDPNRIQFRPITAFLIASMNMPITTTTLTAEDLRGSQSN
jgi:TadE-like protein